MGLLTPSILFHICYRSALVFVRLSLFATERQSAAKIAGKIWFGCFHFWSDFGLDLRFRFTSFI